VCRGEIEDEVREGRGRKVERWRKGERREGREDAKKGRRKEQEGCVKRGSGRLGDEGIRGEGEWGRGSEEISKRMKDRAIREVRREEDEGRNGGRSMKGGGLGDWMDRSR